MKMKTAEGFTAGDIVKAILVAMLVGSSIFFAAGCGGGSGSIANSVTPSVTEEQPLVPAIKKVTIALHQGASTQMLPAAVNQGFSGRYWDLSGPASSIFHFLDCSRYTTVWGIPGCGYPWDEVVDSQEFSNTHGLYLHATDTQQLGESFVGEFSMTEGFWSDTTNTVVLEATPTETFDLYIDVLKDDYVYPSTEPAEGGEISCEGAIIINMKLGHVWQYWTLYRTEVDGSKTYIRVVVAESESSTIVVPAIAETLGGDYPTEYVNSYIQPGDYTLILGYGTTWPTGDYKSREIQLNFKAIGDEGTLGYMCRTTGQRLVGRSDLHFVELPSDKEARTEAEKIRLTKKAMEDFFSNR